MQFLSGFRKKLVAENIEDVQQETNSLSRSFFLRNIEKKAQILTKIDKNFRKVFTFLCNFYQTFERSINQYVENVQQGYEFVVQ